MPEPTKVPAQVETDGKGKVYAYSFFCPGCKRKEAMVKPGQFSCRCGCSFVVEEVKPSKS